MKSYFNLNYRPKVLAILLVVLSLMAFSAVFSSVYTSQEEALAPTEIKKVAQNKPLDTDVNFKKIDQLLANINNELLQPNILKEDILRGWYLGGEKNKKYGTPDNWVFQENGENSRWVSSNAMEEVNIKFSGEMCKQTAGSFKASCLDTADDQCEYVGVSQCECSTGTKWNEEQGCILTTEKGSFVAINSKELDQNYYFGLPNEKKLNTPPDWIWTEDGPQSAWHDPKKIYLKP